MSLIIVLILNWFWIVILLYYLSFLKILFIFIFRFHLFISYLRDFLSYFNIFLNIHISDKVLFHNLTTFPPFCLNFTISRITWFLYQNIFLIQSIRLTDTNFVNFWVRIFICWILTYLNIFLFLFKSCLFLINVNVLVGGKFINFWSMVIVQYLECVVRTTCLDKFKEIV